MGRQGCPPPWTYRPVEHWGHYYYFLTWFVGLHAVHVGGNAELSLSVGSCDANLFYNRFFFLLHIKSYVQIYVHVYTHKQTHSYKKMQTYIYRHTLIGSQRATTHTHWSMIAVHSVCVLHTYTLLCACVGVCVCMCVMWSTGQRLETSTN